MLTEAQRILLEDKVAVWERAASSGTAEWQDYNRRAAEALRAALSLPRPASDRGEEAPVGEAGSMPGTDGFTMAAFRAVDVPIVTKLYTRPVPGVSREEVALLAWLGENPALELSFCHFRDDDEDPAWTVHSVNGGVNDREWTLVGSGATPAEALKAAFALLSRGEG